MNMLHQQFSSYEEMIEDYVCQAFVLGIGTTVPNKNVLTNFISWVIIQHKKDGEVITEQYVRDKIPQYINYLFKKV
jgi:hypothetical protein|tara:strand:+ start:466 stop:693 length:228 start_codon:yes stop_codon:yes gene_type:complete